MIKKQPGKLWRRGRFITRNKVTHLREPIDEYENRIVPIRDWEIDNKIARYALPWARWNGERSKLAVLEVPRRFAA